jgi:uncharacterized membrane protein
VTPAIAGYILVLLGIVAIFAGVAGGVVAMIKELIGQADKRKSFGLSDLPTEFVRATTDYLKALIGAPIWLALIFVGIFLVFMGARMTA